MSRAEEIWQGDVPLAGGAERPSTKVSKLKEILQAAKDHTLKTPKNEIESKQNLFKNKMCFLMSRAGWPGGDRGVW